jgi:Protein of unknown function (DUF551)
MEWIACKDQKPKRHKEVLFLDEEGYAYIGHMWEDFDSIDPKDWLWFAYYNDNKTECVKYWTYIPKRPEEFNWWKE